MRSTIVACRMVCAQRTICFRKRVSNRKQRVKVADSDFCTDSGEFAVLLPIYGIYGIFTHKIEIMESRLLLLNKGIFVIR